MLMDELGYFMDWDLEAVVRGCSSIEAAPTTTTMEDPFLLDDFSHNNNFNLSSELDDDMFVMSFPEFSESTRVLDELEELYKPFYPPVLHTLSPHHQPIIIPKEEDVKVKPPPSQKVAAPQHQQLPSVSKSKRSKKNQNKRVVKEVSAGEIGGCDAWAWRKYGQKPIKGSPYPRSYYRCSSSKGCLARKQVERKHVDPGVFLVTYTAEHNHPHPTRRNSLAGSTRKNNNNSIMLAPTTTTTTTTTCSASSSSNSASSAVSLLSPRTPLVVQSMEDNNNNNNYDGAVTTSSSSSNIIVNNNNKGLKKQEAEDEEDFVELLDDWFPKTEKNIIDDEMMGLDYRLLEMDGIEDGCHFMEHDVFAAT